MWFTKDLANMRKELHRRELKWLPSKGGGDHKQMRSEYLEMRLIYSKAVRREKRSPKEDAGQARTRPEMSEKFWKSMKKMSSGQKKKGVCDLLEVYNNNGNVKAGEEAVKVWKEHFTKILGASNEGAVGDEERVGDSADINNWGTYRLDFSERVSQPISREEVTWVWIR